MFTSTDYPTLYSSFLMLKRIVVSKTHNNPRSFASTLKLKNMKNVLYYVGAAMIFLMTLSMLGLTKMVLIHGGNPTAYLTFIIEALLLAGGFKLIEHAKNNN